jgi:Ca2+/Na+ antiporter
VSDRTESIVAILAAFFVLFSAMLDPRVSAELAVVFLVALAAYKFFRSRHSDKEGRQ